jgi:U6 snRNA-associated Sm-like protein LSm1
MSDTLVEHSDEPAPGVFLPGAASLLEELDKRIMIILLDGQHIIGTLRSFDHFTNMILENACERVIMGNKYADVPLGLYIVRGDNVMMLGTVDEAKEEESIMEKVDPSEIEKLSDTGAAMNFNFEC